MITTIIGFFGGSVFRMVSTSPTARSQAGVTDPHRLAALIDFAFNLGTGNLRAITLRKRVNAAGGATCRPSCANGQKAVAACCAG